MDSVHTQTTAGQCAPCGTESRQHPSEINVGDVERMVSALAGGGLVVAGIRNINSIPGILMTLVGGGLMYRGITGHCDLYEAIGMNTAHRGPATGVPAQHGTRVDKTIVINAAPEEVYAFWRNLENLPCFMSHLKSVVNQGNNRSHWVADAPMGMSVEWDAEIHNERVGEMIAWRSLPGSEVDTAGSVHFNRLPAGRGTEVRVTMKYDPPGGKLGIAVAKLFGEDAAQQTDEDLQRLKKIIEAGEIPTTAGQPSGRVEEAAPAQYRDQVNEASVESFPASDSPSWTPLSSAGPHRSFDR